MSWSDRACAWFWARVAISSRTPSTGLGVLRIATGLFFLVWYMPVRRWVGEAPPAFFNPPPISPARLFSGFPPEAVMVAADVVAVALACLIVVGVKARSCTIALTVLSIAGNVFVAGDSGSAVYPVTGGAYDTTFQAGGLDVFVA